MLAPTPHTQNTPSTKREKEKFISVCAQRYTHMCFGIDSFFLAVWCVCVCVCAIEKLKIIIIFSREMLFERKQDYAFEIHSV